ncbi:hypothetical protein EYV94_09020 [Puteibacter caeruleilacunae]|nr:hypothetical protein EYV94_09020 [Puteibacter caeruleilacunae]
MSSLTNLRKSKGSRSLRILQLLMICCICFSVDLLANQPEERSVINPTVSTSVVPGGIVFNASEWTSVGRGIVDYSDNEVLLKDAFIHSSEVTTGNFSFSFEAKADASVEQVQIWAGFGYHDRDNRYALGMRGGNSNDLYLCRYETTGKDKLLALESLDFEPSVGQWYTFRIVYLNGDIRVYLNDEKQPRIVAHDKTPLEPGKLVIGGGWMKSLYRSVQYQPVANNQVATLLADSVKVSFALTASQKEKMRRNQRKAYKPLAVTFDNQPRQEIDLAGDWLFLPNYEGMKEATPQALSVSDQKWHIMPVPAFWNPARNWLHLQDSGLPHRGSGISDNYREKEEKRCGSYTFDYEQTTGGWYRHWIELPNKLENRKLFLDFDAVSKVADVYVNGIHCGEHIGMFGNFSVDITRAVKPGRNLIAVNVRVRKFDKVADAEENVARAVSVDITNDMLNSLPHGMFAGTEGGIWQPVKLRVVNPVHLTDVFANVNMHGGDFEITIENQGDDNAEVYAEISIEGKESGKSLVRNKKSTAAILKGADSKTLTINLDNLKPKLWSPEEPNMYVLTTNVYQEDKLIDSKQIEIGFREFVSKGNKFYLNGHPYWLRGANHPPCGIAPNDDALANRFMELMHEGNQMITRTHGSPFTVSWMKAADNQGVGVSYEGSWPWLMIGDIPSEELINIWKEETLALVKKYRNHPSLLIWTMNNEMYFTMFYHNDPREVRVRKWKYLSDIIKEVRLLIPNVPISADSGYDRLAQDYEEVLKPNNIDDGDIDDRHIYFNWYNRDFFQIYNGEWDKRIYWTPGANPDRPFFAQEVSTGYPNNDDGHFCRKYIYKHYVPHAWIGDWAWEDHDPAYGLERHAFMTKELVEVIRRKTPNTAGILLFANNCWYKDVFMADKISPYAVHDKVKLAYEPVLISAQLYGRHYFAGEQVDIETYIVNNDIHGNEIKKPVISWELVADNEQLTSGKIQVDAVAHYASAMNKIQLSIPENLTSNKQVCQLKLTISEGKRKLSENEYDLTIANKQWLNVADKLKGKKIGLFDITSETEEVFKALNIDFIKLKDLTQIRFVDIDLLVVANLDTDNEVPYSWEDVRKFAGNGGKVLLLHPGKHLQWLLYDKVESLYERKGRVCHMKVPESSVFDDLEPEDLAWWSMPDNERPRACRRSFRFKTSEGVTPLVNYLRPHVYLGNPKEQLIEMSGTPLVKIKEKNGSIIASEMELNVATVDPIAAKLLINLLAE